MTLYRVTSSYYVAGFIAQNGVVVEAAPILAWTRGKSLSFVLDYFCRKRFHVQNLGGS